MQSPSTVEIRPPTPSRQSSALSQHPCSLPQPQLTLNPRAARVAPAPSLHQPLDKLSSWSSSAQLWSLGLRHAPRSAGGPRKDTYHPARSGPKHPGWGATPQLFPLEKQVEVHGQGGRGRPGASTDPGVVHTSCSVHSVPRAECVGTPGQVSAPLEQRCLPTTDLKECSWGSAFAGPCTAEREAKRELDFPKSEPDSTGPFSSPLTPFSPFPKFRPHSLPFLSGQRRVLKSTGQHLFRDGSL